MTSDAQPRWKNGSTPQRTVGVASASCGQIGVRIGTGSHPKSRPPIASNDAGRRGQRYYTPPFVLCCALRRKLRVIANARIVTPALMRNENWYPPERDRT